ncbi:methionine gamma-lyase family protein, partial [Staphylococcus epidermidis]|nr:methionine gamma-lyase family protein [Staphylococcus epidermidis]
MQDFSNLVEKVENTLIPYFRKIEKRALFNQEKVLNAFHHVKATERVLQGPPG